MIAEPTYGATLALREGGQKSVTRSDVLQAKAKVEEKGLREARDGWSVEVDGKKYDPKWILKFATGAGIATFKHKEARKALRLLGFKIFPNGRLIENETDSTLRDGDDDAEIEQVEEAEELTFEFESDLQNALREHIEQLEPGLEIVDGGHEKQVDSGRVDNMAQDGNGATVVIELKAGEAGRRAIGQILGYTGSLTKDGNKEVRGFLVANEFSARLSGGARCAGPPIEKLYLRIQV